MISSNNLSPVLPGLKAVHHRVDAQIQHLLLDSRQVFFPATALFFAVRGNRHDGHDYLRDAYAAGVRNFIVETFPADEATDANYWRVENSTAALQALAAHHRRQFQLPVLGVTGSNGKTIVKEWLFQLLSPEYHIARSPRSYNSQFGVPLSVWQLQEAHELALFEAGISRPGEMARLQSIIQPTIGVFTGLGSAHSEGFESDQQKLNEKLRLFEEAEVIIYGADNPQVDQAMRGLGRPLLRWSPHDQEADLFIQSLTGKETQTEVVLFFRKEKIKLQLPFQDEASVQNSLLCCAICLYLGLAADKLAERLQHLQAVQMRLEIREGIHNCTLINDSYNSDLNSLQIALQFMEQHARPGRRTLLLSDIPESGQEEALLYKQVARLIRQKKIDRLLAVGKAVPLLKDQLPEATEQHYFPDTETLLEQLPAFDFNVETILLKGARAFGFERIARQLSRQVHQTVLEVNLSAMAYNLHVYHRLLQPGTRMMVMVKAAAYGSGSREIGRLLEFFQVDYLGVAYADEGVELRQAGVQLPILVLNPEEAVFEQLVQYRLEPEIYSLNQLRKLYAFLQARNARLPLHINLDTGMHRLGFKAEELEALLGFLRQHPELEIRSVFSHLAGSDEGVHDAYTRQQIAQFQAGAEQISQVLSYRPLRHILNSNGISRFPQYQFDMVRLGIGIYGLDTGGGLPEPLRTVLSFKATLSQVKELDAGQTVGYGRQGRLQRQSRIATVSAGYADGLPRVASKGAYSLLLHGKRAPIVGNVCMDMCMIDITDIPEARVGDEVVIFGEELPVEELANLLQTIPYEVFTRISTRVKRVYLQE